MLLGSGIGINVCEIIDQFGESFSVIRNDEAINTVRGYRNAEKSPKRNYIGLIPDSDVQEGDVLRSEVSLQLLYVIEANPDVVAGSLFQWKAFYWTEREMKQNRESRVTSTTFNIQNASGSIIGNQQFATQNFNHSVQELKALIDQSNSHDKEELHQLVEQLQSIVEESEHAKGGALARFSEVMQRNTWITGPLGTVIIGWLTHH